MKTCLNVQFLSKFPSQYERIQHAGIKTLSLWANVPPSHWEFCGESYYVCLDVGQMSRYRICIRLKSTFGSGPEQMRKKKTDLVVFTRVQQIRICVRCEICVSVNAAFKAKLPALFFSILCWLDSHSRQQRSQPGNISTGVCERRNGESGVKLGFRVKPGPEGQSNTTQSFTDH